MGWPIWYGDVAEVRAQSPNHQKRHENPIDGCHVSSESDSTRRRERMNRRLPLIPMRCPNQTHVPTLAVEMGTEESITKKRPTSALLIAATPAPNETYGRTVRPQRAGVITTSPPDAVT